MTALAPRIDADVLRRSLSLLDLLPPGAEVKRIGRDAYVTLCCFHSEDRPSMRVTLHRGVWRYRCFPCGAAGDAIDFVMLTTGLSFKDAIAKLADGRGLDLTITTPTKRRRTSWVVACSTPGCTETREAETLAEALLEAACNDWIVCAAEDGAFDYCGPCAGTMRAAA